MKFGGTSLANGERIKLAAKLVQQYSRANQIIVIASAMFGVTDRLIALSETTRFGERSKVFEQMDELRNIHFQALGELKLSEEIHSRTDHALQYQFTNLGMHLKPSVNHEYLISFGERLSSILLSAAICDCELQSKPIVSSEIIIVSKVDTDIEVNTQETRARAQETILPLISQEIIPVVTGFFASTDDGSIVTLGRGGSDYSATILANALDAEEVILWKDVDGVFDEDPRKNERATPFLDLTYDQAIVLAQSGAKILHPECILPVSSKDIVVWIKNTFNPLFRGTRIGNGSIYEEA